MITPLGLKIIASLIACGLLIGGAMHYRQSLINDGIKMESDRRNGLVNAELLAENAKVAAGQSKITELQGKLSKLQSENQSEQTASYITESALRAGTDRLYAAFVQRGVGQVGSPGDSTAPAVDYGAGSVQDLTAEVAGNLESLRRNENNAIDRLGACILAYDKVRSASEELRK